MTVSVYALATYHQSDYSELLSSNITAISVSLQLMLFEATP